MQNGFSDKLRTILMNHPADCRYDTLGHRPRATDSLKHRIDKDVRRGALLDNRFRMPNIEKIATLHIYRFLNVIRMGVKARPNSSRS